MGQTRHYWAIMCVWCAHISCLVLMLYEEIGLNDDNDDDNGDFDA